MRCNERITKSMVKDERADKGGYKVHALLQPMPLEQDWIKRRREKGRNQREKLFKRPNITSIAPNWIGKTQLLMPPINEGITTKNIIRIPWAVKNKE